MTISVVIPAYNAEPYIAEAIESCLQQTPPPLEVIVVDDASTDRTAGIAASYPSPVRLIRFESNQGVSRARNRGVEEASGDWIAFLDADDWFLPGKFAAQLCCAEQHPEAKLIYSGFRWRALNGTERDVAAFPLQRLASMMRYRCAFDICTVLVRRDALREIGGFDCSLKRSEDYELWLRFAARYSLNAFACVPEILEVYRLTPASKSLNALPYYEARKVALERSALYGLEGWRRKIWRRKLKAFTDFDVSLMLRESGSDRDLEFILRSLLLWPLPTEAIPVRRYLVAAVMLKQHIEKCRSRMRSRCRQLEEAPRGLTAVYGESQSNCSESATENSKPCREAASAPRFSSWGAGQAIRISVVIPAYNAARFLPGCLASVFAQTLKPDEVIVVDDGSTDNTAQVAEQHGAKVIQRKNGGIGAARNTGVKNATGEWIALLDADDVWAPEKLARQAAAIRPDTVLVYTGLRFFNDNGTLMVRRAAHPSSVAKLLRYSNPICPSSALLSRQACLAAGGFNESIAACEDWDMWVRLTALGPFAAVEEPLTEYYVYPASMSASPEKMLRGLSGIIGSTLLCRYRGVKRWVWRRRIWAAQLQSAALIARENSVPGEYSYGIRSLLSWPSPFWQPKRFLVFAASARNAVSRFCGRGESRDSPRTGAPHASPSQPEQSLSSRAMRIFVEPGSYHCENMGDVAMMQIAVERLRCLWPRAEIQIVTSRPDRLASLCPSAIPAPLNERNAWLASRRLITGTRRPWPKALVAGLDRLGGAVWRRYPGVADRWSAIKAWRAGREFVSPQLFRVRLKGASLLVVSGMGALNDAFADSAAPLLNEMEAVLDAGIRVAAFGQGVGPITDPWLLKRSRAVLPRLALISLREGRVALPLLKSLGVPEDKIFVTGDDAIEMAYRSRTRDLGAAIGVNVRLAKYAGTDESAISKLREALHAVAYATRRSLLVVPISFHESDSDLDAAEKLFANRPPVSRTMNANPEAIIRLIGECRIVVTGSYHAGVFALAQGIPVVGLIQSDYYEQKFKGLAEQFPAGCRLLDFRRDIGMEQIQDAVVTALDSAGSIRKSLLDAAARQVEVGRRAYAAAFKLPAVDSSMDALEKVQFSATFGA